MTHFVLVYDRSIGEIVSDRRFDDSDMKSAVESRLRSELDNREEPFIEVVLLSAESEEDLRRTHARYFPDDLRDRIAAIG